MTIAGYITNSDKGSVLMVRKSTDMDGFPVISLPHLIHPDHVCLIKEHKLGGRDVYFDTVDIEGEQYAINIRKFTAEECWKLNDENI